MVERKRDNSAFMGDGDLDRQADTTCRNPLRRSVAIYRHSAATLKAAHGGAPYRRRVASFAAAVDRANGANGVKVRSIETDNSDFVRIYQPGHPAADASGYVLKPNVNGLVEAADMKAAQHSYEANLNAIEAAKSMTMRTIDLLK